MRRMHIRGRNRILDPEKKTKLCEMVAQSATVEAAAETLDVSLRTVQRERKLDEDFDHELRLALQAPPDPKKLMESAARVHWRAAAWLLERTDPERYAKCPASSASPAQFDAALTFVLEAALEAVTPEQRDAVYQHVQAACEEAFKCVFPNYGPWGNPKSPQLPPTPLADRQQLSHLKESSCAGQVADVDEARAPAAPKPQSEVAPPPASGPIPQQRPAARQANPRRASSQRRPATRSRLGKEGASSTLPTWLRRDSSPAPLQRGVRRGGKGGEGILSPKMRSATEFQIDDAHPRRQPPQTFARDLDGHFAGVRELERFALRSAPIVSAGTLSGLADTLGSWLPED